MKKYENEENGAVMKRREFLRNGLLIGSAALLPEIGHSMPVEDSTGQLFQAIIDGRFEVLEVFIRKSGNVNIKGKMGWTPLYCVVALGKCNITALKMLLDAGADINAETEDGSTPLHEAACWRKVECVRFLVEHGADPKTKNEFGLTPLDYARASENKPVIEYLTGLSNSTASL